MSLKIYYRDIYFITQNISENILRLNFTFCKLLIKIY